MANILEEVLRPNLSYNQITESGGVPKNSSLQSQIKKKINEPRKSNHIDKLHKSLQHTLSVVSLGDQDAINCVSQAQLHLKTGLP